MLKHSLIRGALDVLSFSQAKRWLPNAPDCGGFIVTLHHVLPARADAFQPNALLSVTPDFLDRFLAHFKAAGWRFVSVDELAAGDGDSRRIAVTLDDGYRNNLDHAWPVFRKHCVPFTIYVCTGFCDRTAELWWEALDRIIAGADHVERPGGGEALATGSPAEKQNAFRLWTEWLTTTADEAEQRRAIRTLSAKHSLELGELARELVMDWDEVRRIAADPLTTIGAHTLTHPALARLAPNAALREMRDSADRIASEVGRRPTSLAFPYGYAAAAGPREARLAEEAGFIASVTTRPGYVRKGGPRHALPRVSLNGLFQELRYVETLLTPGLWRVRDRIRKPA